MLFLTRAQYVPNVREYTVNANRQELSASAEHRVNISGFDDGCQWADVIAAVGETVRGVKRELPNSQQSAGVSLPCQR